jgi:hypothetical protein
MSNADLMFQFLYEDLKGIANDVRVIDTIGVLPVVRGGTGTGIAFTQGSVVFAGAGGVYSQDNAKFFWDDTNFRLQIPSILFPLGTLFTEDALGVLSIRAGLNPNHLFIYNTFTDFSNYESVFIGWSANTVNITTNAAGTGNPDRSMTIGCNGLGNLDFKTNNAPRWEITAGAGHIISFVDNTMDIGSLGANRPRVIYAGTFVVTPIVQVDSVRGTAGLLDFYTSATARWELSGGNWLAFSDNAYDIGAAGANRPRTLYAGTSLITPVVTAATSVTAPAIIGSTSVSTPSLISAAGALTITPAAGSSLIVALSTTGDFAVNTNQLYADTSTGWVGIGVSEPLAVLEMDGSTTGAVQLFIHNKNGALNSSTELVFGNWSGAIPTGSSNPGPQAKISAAVQNAGDARTDLIFSVQGSSVSLAEAMRIKNTGFVGIGTTNPLQALVVSRAGNEGFEIAPLGGNINFSAYDRTALAYVPMLFSSLSMSFKPSGANGWLIDASSNFLAITDNTYDIGASGGTRPRTGYFATSVVVSGPVTTTEISLPNTGGAATCGQITLVLGTKTINTTRATATCLIFFQRVSTGGTIGFATTYTVNAGVSFTINSDSALDTSVYNWMIIETH